MHVPAASEGGAKILREEGDYELLRPLHYSFSYCPVESICPADFIP